VHLKGLTKLKVLDLGNTQITDTGLAHLSGLTKLQRLELTGTKVTDAGLVRLERLTSLKSLFLDSTSVTQKGAERLKRALPKVKVFLGEARNRATREPAEGAAFGPATERVVAYRKGFPSEAVPEPGSMYLDLDTGAYAKFKALPDSKMLRDAGVDVYYEPKAEGTGARLARSNLQVQPLSDKTGWNSSPRNVWRALVAASPYSLKYPGRSTLAVKTGDGGLGILQILGLTKDRLGIRIRYKMLQPPKAGRSATAPATQPATVSGKVLGADGKPLAGVQLTVKCLDQRRKWAGHRQIQSDERGRFKIRNLSPGEVFICYEKGSKDVPERAGDAQMFISHVRVEAGKAVENVLVDLSKATCAVKGRLVDHKGKGIAGATVQALYAPSWVAHCVWTRTDEHGRYRIASLPPHEFRVFAHIKDHYGGPGKQIKLKPGRVETIDMLAYIPSRAAPKPKPDDPRWGRPKGDLRAGIQLRPRREAYAIGEIVELKPILRNTGKKTVTLVHDFAATSELQVTDEAGKTRTFGYKTFTGETVSTTYVLQPGHEVEMQASVRLKLVGADSREGLIQKPGLLAFPMKSRPGAKYRLSYDLGGGFRTGEVRSVVEWRVTFDLS